MPDPDTVTIPRAELEAILDELEDAEDRIAVLEYKMERLLSGPEHDAS